MAAVARIAREGRSRYRDRMAAGEPGTVANRPWLGWPAVCLVAAVGLGMLATNAGWYNHDELGIELAVRDGIWFDPNAINLVLGKRRSLRVSRAVERCA